MTVRELVPLLDKQSDAAVVPVSLRHLDVVGDLRAHRTSAHPIEALVALCVHEVLHEFTPYDVFGGVVSQSGTGVGEHELRWLGRRLRGDVIEGVGEGVGEGVAGGALLGD